VTDAERKAAFERLFSAHFRTVVAYARRRAAPAEADDAVAETFLVAWRRLEDVPADANAWLLGVARRVLANQRRAAARRSALAADVAHTTAPELRPAATAAPVMQAIATLPERDRAALLLAAWEGLSTAEIAVALGCSRAAAKVRLHRARRKLRRSLDELEDFGAHAIAARPAPLEEAL
jgi:RNA polymerase sigma-70 factor (ECF subfamily)